MNLLWVLPIVQFALLWQLSAVRGTRRALQRIYAVMYLDWLFIPFNVFWLSAVAFTWRRFAVIAIVTLLGIFWLHERWRRHLHRPETRFFVTADGLTPEGIVHFAFMAIQAPLVLYALLFPLRNDAYLALLVCMLVYVIGYLVIIHRVRRINIASKEESPILVAGLLIVCARLVWLAVT